MVAWQEMKLERKKGMGSGQVHEPVLELWTPNAQLRAAHKAISNFNTKLQIAN